MRAKTPELKYALQLKRLFSRQFTANTVHSRNGAGGFIGQT
jgi:hypothetical protein